MPGVNLFPGETGPLIGQMAARMRAFVSQQQSTITNAIGQALLNFGLSPGSNPAQYGMQMVNPSTGAEIGFLGEDADGNVALKFRTASGVVQVQLDVNGLHFYDTSGDEVVRVDGTGLHVYNASGTEEVAAGLINASPAIYGLGVLPYGGATLQQVGGSISVSPPNVSNVANTTWAAFGSPASITAEIGPSGEVVVSCGGYIATGTAGEHGYIGVSVDGGSFYSFADLGSGGGATAGTVGTTQTWSGLTAGTHTFEVGYLTSSNGTANCSFSAVNLTIQPR